MARRWLLGCLFALLLVAASVAGSAQSTQSGGFADVLVGDIVIGESAQEFPGMRAVEFPADAETVRLELDLAVLTNHGIDVSDAAVELSEEAVRGATVETATVSDGRVILVFAPDDSTDDAILAVESFRLTGLDTADADAAAGLTFDAAYSGGEARVRSFDIVDPDEVTAELGTNTLFTESSTQRVTLQDVHAAGGNVTVEVDVRVLEDHGYALADLEAEVTADGATVVSTSVDRGVVTVIVSPADDTVLFDVRMELRGLDSTSSDSDQRVIASDVSYGVAVDGAAGGDVAVEPFDIAAHPTTHADPVTTRTTTSGPSLVVEGDGFGPVLTLVAGAFLLLLVRRRD